ncbi:MAG: PEP/pyruvate-binding domain-containing protein [Thermodesulfobacteriota bacterium]|nr:PEP/pyruvate-binding domain-containing protein [Thermodesulfobacteriota bacterium]
MSLVLALHEIRNEHRPLVGGKGFALAALVQRTMAVPEALCVTTQAYHQYLSSGGLRDRIGMELNRKPFQEMRWEELWDAALRVQNLFLQTPFSKELYEAICMPIAEIFGDKAVVVRSSALGEDTAQSSFAGLHESYVNVRGTEAILDHIRLVWASLWSDRALLYRQELNLQVEKSAMAVVIQEILVGERSGVVFGKDPNDPSQTVIEAVYGLNQGLVDGTVEPDRWILDRQSGRLISHVPASRKKAMVPVPGGLLLDALQPDKADCPPLDQEEMARVFELSRKTEEVFDAPQDVEWTFGKDVLYVLQSRPVASPLSTAHDDKRPWYLSLKKSFETLKGLRKTIEAELIPQMHQEGRTLAASDLDQLSDVELAKEIELRRSIYQKWARIYEEAFIPMAHGIRLFGQVYNNTVRPSDPYEFMTLLGATEMVSLRRNGMLDDLAAMIRSNPKLAERLRNGDLSVDDDAFHAGLRDFADEFTDLSCGTDQCVSGQHAIAKLLLEMAGRPSLRQAVPKKDFQGLKDAFLSRFQANQRSYAEELLDLGRASYRLRDDDNIYLGQVRAQMDRAVSEGRNRVKSTNKTEGRASAAHSLAKALKTHDLLFQTHLSPVSEKAGLQTTVRQIVGQPAGPGIGKGPARVIADPSDLMDFQAGEILVCDALDPTMTFVVPLSEGIVERRGGMLIHGAIIAREYGLPCVTGIPEAASVIKNGEQLTVDGYLGIVTIHREA